MKNTSYIRSLRTKSEITNSATILTPIDNETDVIVINEIGFVIYELIDGKRTCGEIASIVSGKYNASYEDIFSDTEDFCINLEKRGFIEKLPLKKPNS